MNETTVKLIHWIWSEPRLADFLRDVANGDPETAEFEYGDTRLGVWLSDLLDGSAMAHIQLARLHVSLPAARTLTRELENAGGTDRYAWLEEMDVERIRNALLGDKGAGYPIYVHATIAGFDPAKRYRVYSKHSVCETSGSSAGEHAGLSEWERQVCPVPIEAACSCTVERSDA